jgi:glyoxylase I family protein
MFTGIEHTAIASPDPKRLAEWYVEKLGFVINYNYDVFYFVKAPNGMMLEIIPAEGAAPSFSPKTPGLRHLAIAVDQFDAAYAELKQRGVKVTSEPLENQGNRLAWFEDLDGNICHIVARQRPLP